MAPDPIQGLTSVTGRVLPLLALRGTVVFPYAEASLQVGRPASLSAVREAMQGDNLIVLAAQRDPKDDHIDFTKVFPFGTLAVIKYVAREDSGVVRVSVEGLARVRLVSCLDVEPHMRVVVELAEEEQPRDPSEIGVLLQAVKHKYQQIRRMTGYSGSTDSVLSLDDPGRVADLIASTVVSRFEDKQAILEELSVKQRLERLSRILFQETELIELERKIEQRVRRQLEKTQREYYLREQLKAIQKELGEADEPASEAEEFRRLIQKSGMPPAVAEKALREADRLARMPQQAAEAIVVRNYLEWLTSLPWSERTEDRLDIAEARKVLDEDHYGLEKVKERILEFLAVRKLVQERTKGPILCLVGPPGVGKTSLARSIARALGRRFVRVSLGGVRDEAEIRGHRRTYVAAMPGRIIQGMRQAGSRNPVFLLDEVDKMTVDFRGDPAAALLEVLDPEQNSSFSDHYIEAPFDLSEVLFITTANSVYTIPRPLLDRMEVIFIPGYTEQEKVAIAQKHLLPKQLSANGLDETDVSISRPALLAIVQYYTREGGVRHLERQLGAICRKVAREVAEHGRKGRRQVTVRNLHEFLGQPPFRYGLLEPQNQVGVAVGVGWTEFGGDIMAIEVAAVAGKGGLVLTGKLGEVMRESAQAAYSYIRSRAPQLGIDEHFYEKCDLHVHVLEGAVPKDGPSAGITIATAIVSALTGIPVKRDVAMTGEITLRGRVLPVGGLREKVLAAQRSGIKTMIVPEANRRDIEEIPRSLRNRLNFVFVQDMDQVLVNALCLEGAGISQEQDQGDRNDAVCNGQVAC